MFHDHFSCLSHHRLFFLFRFDHCNLCLQAGRSLLYLHIPLDICMHFTRRHIHITLHTPGVLRVLRFLFNMSPLLVLACTWNTWIDLVYIFLSFCLNLHFNLSMAVLGRLD